jgi:hypothetical protein
MFLDLLNELLGLAGAETAHKAQQDVHVVVVHQQVYVDTDLVDTGHTDIFKGVLELGLIDHLLQGVQVQVEHLVLLDHETPQV